MRAGVIVAGGRSRRFGEADKALAEVGGVPMVRRVADRLAGCVDHLVVNCRRAQRAPLERAMTGHPHERRFALDRAEDRGPVAGIATGLRAVDPRTTAAFVVACDVPFVAPGLVERLFERANAHPGADAVVPRTADGWYQVLHAVYRPASTIEACERALAAGEAKPLVVLDDLDVVTVEIDAADEEANRSFANVNTAADLAEVNAALGG